MSAINKAKIKTREGICVICNEPFKFRSPYYPTKTCSAECRRVYNLESIHIRNRKDFDHVLMILSNSTKSRAKTKGLKYELDFDYLKQLFIKQKGRCFKTGISFKISIGKTINCRSPWSLSLDRINPKIGYTKENVQLVCIMYNLCKGTWSDKDVKKLAKAIVKN